ncbi:MAG: DUF434 domain-containing protein [Clostridia bacterium]|nr:DUF434 domain-containing protein [Clostridia bacterium]
MQTASAHVFYLINEGYDLKQAAAFVGNHLQLSERQRMAVMRSLASREQLAAREKKRIGPGSLAGREVWIDGFNTVITLEVMLNESILFRGMDGCIRDLASLRGTYRTISETAQAVRLLIEQLQGTNVGRSHILLDRPVSNSGRLKTLIAETAEERSCDIDVQIIDDVDRILWEKANVITSDAIILDHCSCWVNLLAECVKKHGGRVLQVWC